MQSWPRTTETASASTIGAPRWHVFLVNILPLVLAGCGQGKVQNTGARTEIRVAAASNLKFAFDDIVAVFQSQHPDMDVAVTYGSSGNFFAQLSNKAPFDMFLSADVEYPRKLIQNGLAVKDSEFIYAVGRIALWVPSSSKLDLATLGLRAIDDPSVRRIAIANPKHAPYGRAAETLLKNLGVYQKIQERLIFGENIEQAAQFVDTGAADIGIVSLSLALSPRLKERGRHWILPDNEHLPLEQAGVILTWARDIQACDKLRAFLLDQKGREILTRYGYGFPELPRGTVPHIRRDTYMQAAFVLALVFVESFAAQGADDKSKPLTPTQAIKNVNEKVWVEMYVKTTKNRLEKRGEIYLDSEEDFHDPKNLGVVITKVGAAKFKEAGVDDPAVRFKDKTIRVKGTLTIKEMRPRIEVEEPKQIQIVEKKQEEYCGCLPPGGRSGFDSVSDMPTRYNRLTGVDT